MRVYLIEERAMVRKALELVAKEQESEGVFLLASGNIDDFSYQVKDWQTQVLVISLSLLQQNPVAFFAQLQACQPMVLVGIGSLEEVRHWETDQRFAGLLSRPLVPGDFFRQLQILAGFE